jgi:excisionase family DNA binding protein
MARARHPGDLPARRGHIAGGIRSTLKGDRSSRRVADCTRSCGMGAYAHPVLKLARLTDSAESSDVITVEEAAELSGLSQQTIRRRCLSGEIKANKVGKQWLIHAKEFESSTPKKGRSASTSLSTLFDHDQAINHIRRTDLSELWVPDVLRLQDHFNDKSSATAEAQRRIEQGS